MREISRSLFLGRCVRNGLILIGLSLRKKTIKKYWMVISAETLATRRTLFGVTLGYG